jgi:hypothetical protein
LIRKEKEHIETWIRFFEYFLYVAYRPDIKKWQARGDDDSRKVKKHEELIQKKFRSEMGPLVEQAKPGGCGTTDDGNMARRFFKNPSHSTNITGLSEVLISRCAVILQALLNGHTKNLEEFDQYAKERADLLVKKYPWYYMPASVHRV